VTATSFLTVAATGLALLQVVPYVRSILQGKTRPSRVACLIWLLMDCVTLAGLITVGFSGAAWLTLAFIATQLVVMVLLPKYGVGGKSKFDIICFCIGVLAIVGWIFIQSWFGQARYGAIFAVLLTTSAVAIANINMIRKLVRLPLTEDVLAWVLTWIAGGLTISSLVTGHSGWIDFVPPSLTFTTSAIVVGLQRVQKTRATQRQLVTRANGELGGL